MTINSPGVARPRDTRPVEVQHDEDGLWYRGTLLHSYRAQGGRWRAVVRYLTGPGAQYQRGVWQEQVRREGSGEVVDTSKVPAGPGPVRGAAYL